MIRAVGLCKKYGRTEVLRDFSLEMPAGKITCIVGPSGCGKTTLLQLLAGLEEPDAGRVEGVAGRRLSYVFQEPRLLPWKTVWENIAFVLGGEGPAAAERAERFLRAMGLWEFKNSYPKELSGGMKQRAALCRAFAYPHDVLFLDEPFKSLDTPLRLALVRLLAEMWAGSPRPVIIVTHDIFEALLLGHRVVVLSPRPAKVLEELEIDLPHAGRSPSRRPLPELYERILGLLSGS